MVRLLGAAEAGASAREKVLEPSCGMIGPAAENLGEPSLRVDAVQLRSFDQRVHGGRAFAPAIGAGEGPVVATDRDSAQRPFGGVIKGHGARGAPAGGNAAPSRVTLTHLRIPTKPAGD